MPSFMTNMKSKFEKNIISLPSDEEVRKFLILNPDFFIKYPDVLNSLNIIHESGAAVSLIQRQVDILRSNFQSNDEYLNSLVEIAKKNELLLNHSKQLISEIINAEDIQEIVNKVEDSFVNKLGATECKLFFLENTKERKLPQGRIKDEKFSRLIREILNKKPRFFGRLEKPTIKQIFKTKSLIQDSSIIKLNCVSTTAVLIFGSDIEGKYSKDKDTVFLDFITDILSKIIDKKYLDAD